MLECLYSQNICFSWLTFHVRSSLRNQKRRVAQFPAFYLQYLSPKWKREVIETKEEFGRLPVQQFWNQLESTSRVEHIKKIRRCRCQNVSSLRKPEQSERRNRNDFRLVTPEEISCGWSFMSLWGCKISSLLEKWKESTRREREKGKVFTPVNSDIAQNLFLSPFVCAEIPIHTIFEATRDSDSSHVNGKNLFRLRITEKKWLFEEKKRKTFHLLLAIMFVNLCKTIRQLIRIIVLTRGQRWGRQSNTHLIVEQLSNSLNMSICHCKHIQAVSLSSDGWWDEQQQQQASIRPTSVWLQRLKKLTDGMGSMW